MSELTTVARPYAKAAFDFAVEAKSIDSWLAQLTFAAEVAKDETIVGYLSGGVNEGTHNIVYNLADFINKILFGIVIWAAAVKDSGK